MNAKLFLQAILKFLLGVVLVGGLIFLPAWTADFWQGWLLMGILFVPMFFAGLVMLWKNPALLAKRLDGKEKQKEQGIVVKLSGLMFVGGFKPTFRVVYLAVVGFGNRRRGVSRCVPAVCGSNA